MNSDKILPIHSNFTSASQLVFGCMGLGGGWNNNAISKTDVSQASEIVNLALELGINVFDHADIYTFGKAEQVFGQVLKNAPGLREHMFIQSKCGIRFADNTGPKRYDFSASWISHSVEKSLQQLNVDYLDMLLLHRPDPLMDIAETAVALNQLAASGKVKSLGVSNMHHGQIKLLQSELKLPIVANQIEMSLAQLDWLEDGITTGSRAARDNDFATGLLEYCQLHNIQMQAWGSMAQGKVTSHQKNESERQAALVNLVEELASIYQTSAEAIALGWLMRLPMAIQPVIGTTNPDRIKACAKAQNLILSREHWYQLYETARGAEMP